MFLSEVYPIMVSLGLIVACLVVAYRSDRAWVRWLMYGSAAFNLVAVAVHVIQVCSG